MSRITRYYLALVLALIGHWQASGQLSADFSADPRSGCAPIRVLFTDKSAGSPTSWRWDLGNGVISTAKDPSTTYFVPGVYNIKLTIFKGTDSATVTKSSYITVFAVPTIGFSGSPLSGCVVLPVQFRDLSVAGSGTMVEWKWDFGDGNLSTSQHPLHFYRTQGNFRVTLTAKNSDGCTNSATVDNYVTVNDSLRAKFGQSFIPSCNVPLTVSFKDSSVGNNILSWEWDFGDGGVSNAQNPFHTYSIPGSYDVRLIVRNSSGCIDTLIKKSLINAGNLKSIISMPNDTLCLGSTVLFQSLSTPVGAVDSTIWVFSDGQVRIGHDIYAIFNTPGTYNVRQTVYKGSCQDASTATFVVVPNAGGNFSVSPPEACKPPLPVRFQNASGTGTHVLSWDFGDGTTGTGDSLFHTYTQFGSFNVTMIVQNSFGCIDTVRKPAAVIIAPPQITSIKGLPYDGCFPHTINMDPVVATNDPVVSWFWDFGDGTTSTLQRPSKTYTVNGGYDVRLIIVTASGCRDTLKQSVKGSVKPNANFQAAPLVVCPSTEVKYADLSSGTITKWSWFFGDGGNSNSQSPTWFYNDTGWMNVRLIVFNNGCSDTLTRTQYIYVSPPIARIADSFVCANQRDHFFTNNSIGALTWKWYFGDGDSSVVWNPRHLYADTGRYSVRLVIADTLCEHQATYEVLVLNEKAAISAVNEGGCNSNVVKFMATSPQTHPHYISRYEWTFDNDPPIITDTNFVYKDFPDTATITLKLKIFDLNGCTDSITKSYPIIFTAARANFGPAMQNVCVGTPASFADSSRAIASNPIKKWFWDFGDGSGDSLFTAPPFRHVYKAPGMYDVRLIIEDAQGCRDTVERLQAVIAHQPIASFVSADTIICLNTPARFVNSSYGAALTYSWNFGNGTQSAVDQPTIVYANAGVYDVRLAIQDGYGCVDTLNRLKYVVVSDAHADFNMSDSFSTCPPLLVNFTNKSASNVVNIWTFGNGNSSNLVDPSHTYTSPGDFTVKLKVVGNGGCSDSLTRQVKIQGPSGTFTYAPLSGCPPLQVSFTSKAINTKFFTWDFSDGQSDVTLDSNASHIYNVPGTFVPRLILEDGLGCKLPVQGPDTIRLFGAKALIKKLQQFTYCDSATVAFTDSTITTDVVSRYRWKFGDGAESSLQNPTHTYTTPGRYTITLEVWTQNNCYTTDTLKTPVVIAESPRIDFASDSAVCIPAMVQFTGYWLNPDTSVVSYQWDFGNGLNSPKLVPDPVGYNTPGTVQVKMQAVNNYGCKSLIMKPLVVNDTPKVVASPNAFLCQGQSVVLQASGATAYTWDAMASLNCLNCAGPTATPLTQTTYRVTGTDANGCKSSDTLLVRVKLPGSLSVSLRDTICVGEKVQLQSQGFEIIRWSPAVGLDNANIPNPVARPQTTTTYIATGTDSLNCFTQTATVTIVVYPIPQFNIVETLVKAEQGTVVPIKTLASTDVSRYAWTPAAGLSCANCAEPFATVTQKRTYTAEVSNAGGCRSKDEIDIEPYCTTQDVFVPNTFSPNGDGNNDVFYPRGKGLTNIKSFIIFNRWGEVVYERKNFGLNDPTAGWNGRHKGVLLTPDVYVYLLEGVCGNNEPFGMKGNVTLIR